MRRASSVFAAVFNTNCARISDKMNLISDIKKWKFKTAPSYAQLPIDENPNYNVPTAVKNAVFSKVPVEPLEGKIQLVCISEVALRDCLDLSPTVSETEEFLHFVAGRYLPEGGMTVCHRYGGYQFGFWSDQLGDGRAHILGEYINSKGESWQPQLKGSGETPYSRFGDGRAVLRSSIREMIASEACHYLGIPTTRACALVVSEDHRVYRDKNYTGHAKQEKAAIVMRLATAWYRIGSLEILLKRKEPELLKDLVDFIIKNHFPEIDSSSVDKYVKWYTEVAHRNLDMVATWQGFGFTHGVLNTDNVSLMGVTIDYGPYGFIDHFYEHFVPNSSDDMGRYAYNKQPTIMLWNLEKLAEALEPILTEADKQKIKEVYFTLEEYVAKKVLSTYLLKLGLNDIQDGDSSFVQDLLKLMEQTMADFTCTFRQLGEVDSKLLGDKSVLESKWALAKICQAGAKWEAWAKRYQERLEKEGVSEEDRRSRMRRVNPAYVPRNWILQEAIQDAENNNFEKVRFLLDLLRSPFEDNEEADTKGYSSPPPSWAYGLKLSCSS